MAKKLPQRVTQTASAENRAELIALLSHVEDRWLEFVELRLDGGTQPREALDEESAQEYGERMVVGEDAQRRARVLDPQGESWPGLTVFYDGEHRWLADGFHRVAGAKRAGIGGFQCRVSQGTQRDAILHSLGVNATHGKRRTNADKRRAAERALRDEEWGSFSDNRLAELCKVSQPFISKLRGELAIRGAVVASQERVGQDGVVHDVSTRQAVRESVPREESTVNAARVSVVGSNSGHEGREVLYSAARSRREWSGLLRGLPDKLKQHNTLIITLNDGVEGLWGWVSQVNEVALASGLNVHHVGVGGGCVCAVWSTSRLEGGVLEEVLSVVRVSR